MTLQLSAQARIGRDPRAIDTSTGKAMAVAPAAVNVPIARSEEHGTIWLDLVAFGKTAEALLRHHRGDLINVMGNVALRQWVDKDGQSRESWQLIIESLISARTTRPGGGRSRQQPERAADPAPAQQAVFDDAIPF